VGDDVIMDDGFIPQHKRKRESEGATKRNQSENESVRTKEVVKKASHIYLL
jgi:hypothetical protein